jgi:hypothetical protein
MPYQAGILVPDTNLSLPQTLKASFSPKICIPGPLKHYLTLNIGVWHEYSREPNAGAPTQRSFFPADKKSGSRMRKTRNSYPVTVLHKPLSNSLEWRFSGWMWISYRYQLPLLRPTTHQQATQHSCQVNSPIGLYSGQIGWHGQWHHEHVA